MTKPSWSCVTTHEFLRVYASGNEINDDAVTVLVDVLKDMPNLKALILAGE